MKNSDIFWQYYNGLLIKNYKYIKMRMCVWLLSHVCLLDIISSNISDISDSAMDSCCLWNFEVSYLKRSWSQIQTSRKKLIFHILFTNHLQRLNLCWFLHSLIRLPEIFWCAFLSSIVVSVIIPNFVVISSGYH